MRYQIPSVQVGKRSAKNRGVLRNHLNQSPELRHTLRIPNHPGNSRALSRSKPHSHDQQHQRDKNDLHLGSLHSRTVLRVDGCSKLVRTLKIRERRYRMRGYRLSPIEIRITMSPVLLRICLIHNERRRFCDLLLRYSVIYFDADLIFAGSQACQRQTLFNRYLVRVRIRL